MSSSEPPLNANIRGGNPAIANGYDPTRFPLGSGFNPGGSGSASMSAASSEFVPNKDSQERSSMLPKGDDAKKNSSVQGTNPNPADANGIAGSVMSNNR